MRPEEFRDLVRLRLGLVVGEPQARAAVARLVSMGVATGVRGRDIVSGLERVLDVSGEDLLDDGDPPSAGGVVVRPW